MVGQTLLCAFVMTPAKPMVGVTDARQSGWQAGQSCDRKLHTRKKPQDTRMQRKSLIRLSKTHREFYMLGFVRFRQRLAAALDGSE